ncbi:FAST kinase domain-containing protein 5, mitochondrial [Zerene cesonia]|uniref:FAST kinase domain-containing protein 5, mitochondrial n=1 Tax=Zerene cesonia TaxID=33412 RepID=UPI0018E572C3|nr:FAST kinase domain-containing protein 5, mitochondrial [Zerene cesonia]
MVLIRQLLRKCNIKYRIFNYCSLNFASNRPSIAQSKYAYVDQKFLHRSSNLFVKMFMERENQYAYDIMEKYGYVEEINIPQTTSSISQEEFENMMKKDWSKESAQAVFEVFPLITAYCSENNLCISNNVFDNFIDVFTDKIQFSTDEELKSHFFSLAKCPETASIRTRNYVEVWAALDDECVNRFKRWSHDELLSFAALFYMLSATKASDYCYRCIQRLVYKSNKLTKAQLVQTYFFIGAMRFSPHDMHNLEIAVQEKFHELSIDELAIISLGFFKSKVPIRSPVLVSNIIDLLIENVSEINEVSLAALLKVIRFSRKIPVDDKIVKLLDKLQHEVPRLSIMCNVHIALLATSTLTLQKSCLQEIANNVIKDISNARLKDMERLILTFGTFNYEPLTNPSFIETIINELRKPEREQELFSHGRSFACCLSYLGLLGYYPIDLFKRVLNTEFLNNTYGKYCYAYGREILIIHNSVKLFHKDTSLDCLTAKEALILAKKYTDFLPDANYDKQYNVTEKMYLDVVKVVEECRGGSEFVTGHHLLTHHQRGDVVMCDDPNGSPLPVKSIFNNIKFGQLCPIPNDNIWIALIIAGRNAMLYNSEKPSGHFLSKIRELNALGYHAAIVSWNVYTKCKTLEEKKDYINKLINEAKSRKDYDVNLTC